MESVYSFVALSILGYGDIVGLTHSARGLSATEALVGQLYVAILVARLVGLHIVHETRARSGSSADS